MPTYISSLGSFVPPVVTIEEAVDRGWCDANRHRSGGLLGAAVAGDLPAPEMALRAARRACARNGTDPASIDLLLYATTWPQGPEGWLAPSYLQQHLVGGDTLSIEIKQGCNALFGAIEVAAAYLHADPRRENALLVATDNYGTPLMDRWNTGGPFIPGDAATAVVLSTSSGVAEVLAVGTLSSPAVETDLTMLDVPLFPPDLTVGRAVDFSRDGAPDAAFLAAARARNDDARDKLVRVVEDTMDRAGVSMADIARTAVINVDRGFIEGRGMTALGVDIEKTTWQYGRSIGHCGASDPFLGLEHLLDTDEVGSGDNVLMIASGPSTTVSCAVVQIS